LRVEREREREREGEREGRNLAARVPALGLGALRLQEFHLK